MAAQRLILVAVLGGLVLLLASPGLAAPARTSILEPLVVHGRVDGDVVAMGADVTLAPDADVRGHVIAVFARVDRQPGARVSGTILGVSSLAGLTLYDDAVEVSPATRIGLRLAVAGLWLLGATLLAALSPSRLRRGTWLVGRLGLRTAVLGLLVLMTALAALIAAVGLGPGLGVPLAVLVMVVFLFAKLVGVTVLGGALGSWLVARFLRRVAPLPTAVFAGVVLLVGTRLVPVIGSAAWSAVSVVALGAGVFALAFATDDELLGVSVPTNLSRR